jgi:hypothetical protein
MTFIAALFAALGGRAISAQDKYSVRVPNGPAFAEIRGYEDWPVVAVSQIENGIKVIVANPIAVEAYRAGIPGNGKPFPDGSKIAKITWKPKKNTQSPFPVMVPDTLAKVQFEEKDSKKFGDTDGWGWANFPYNSASQAFVPDGNDAKCGYACHTLAAKQDFVFTAYPQR